MEPTKETIDPITTTVTILLLHFCFCFDLSDFRLSLALTLHTDTPPYNSMHIHPSISTTVSLVDEDLGRLEVEPAHNVAQLQERPRAQEDAVAVVALCCKVRVGWVGM